VVNHTVGRYGYTLDGIWIPADKIDYSDPRFRAFAERAMRAIRDPRCSALPIPRSELGKIGKLTFRFKP
jgi:hypothetical protein